MPKREFKGKSVIDFPENYCVIDLETTGFDPFYDEIIELGAMRIRNGEPVDSFSILVKPRIRVDNFVAELTGITNEELSGAPTLEEVLPAFLDFVGEDVVVGHNVSFDVNFVYDASVVILGKPFKNDCVDMLRIARKLFPDMGHHRLADVSGRLEIVPSGAHRAAADCQTTFDCFCSLRDLVATSGSVEDFIGSFKRRHTSGSSKKIDLRIITSENTEFDETHPLFGKRCVFTGTLEKMTRAEAAQFVVDFGGICENGVTKNTNFLILGVTDYKKTGGDKSAKHRKAEQYKLDGLDIEIISENVFYDMLELQ